MVELKADILIVDNDPAVCFSLAQVIRMLGYSVRAADGGFEAIREINARRPDILISDLNMPSMSGFELLSITRRRFPHIFSIGMTGAFIDRLPRGIAADGFYRKAGGLPALFDLLKQASEADMRAFCAAREDAPIWVTPLEDDCLKGERDRKRLLIGCPECLRAFPPALVIDYGADGYMGHTPLETVCAYCSTPIQFAVVEEFA